MVGTKTVKVGEHEYQITQLGALEGRKIWHKLVTILAPILANLSAAKTLDKETISSAVNTLMVELDEPTFEMLCKTFAKRCRIRNGADKWPEMDDTAFDQHFAGDYIGMTQWLGECLVYNFANFSGDASLGKLINTVKAKAAEMAATASKSKSQPVSTGSSGA